jgi:hypothetical protein
MCIGKMEPVTGEFATHRHNFGFIDNEGPRWQHKNLPHCGPGTVECYEQLDCESYRRRYIPDEDLLVMADWFEQNYPISDYLLSRHPDFHPSEATDIEDLRGYRKYDEVNWLCSVYPDTAVGAVSKRAHEIYGESGGKDEDARTILGMADAWLNDHALSFVEVCTECMECINHGEWDVTEEPTVFERIERRWPNHQWNGGWPHDPNTTPYTDDTRSTDFTRSQCNGCGRHPAGERYKYTVMPTGL